MGNKCCNGKKDVNDANFTNQQPILPNNASGNQINQNKKDINQLDSTEPSQQFVRIPNDKIQKLNQIILQKIQLNFFVKNVKLSSKTITINPKIKKRYGINAQFVDVPFDVIVLTMHPDLIECLKQFQQIRYYKFVNEAKAGQKTWKLHKNGYYVNYQEGYKIFIIDTDTYYYGPLQKDINQRIVPKQNGILVTTSGIYEGDFLGGKAHGKGKYIDYIKKPRQNVSYEGNWSQGVLTEGEIRCKQYIFSGLIQDNKANGQGKIRFKRALYQGNFQNGIYQTKQKQKAKYQTPAYLYQGQFNKGFKQGLGLLVEKDRTIKDKKVKYHPPDEYPGEYKIDYYITPKHLRHQYEVMLDKKQKLIDSKNKQNE